MATLAEQLRSSALPALHEGSGRIFSFMFDPAEAKLMHHTTVFELGENGYLELSKINPNFRHFGSTLFSSSYQDFKRELASVEEITELNEQISEFLALVSDFVLIKAGQKALEYLCRKFLISRYNVDDLILCLLPSFETSLFARVLMITKVEETRWNFLTPLKKTGLPVSRTALVAQCDRDSSILNLISESQKASHERGLVSPCSINLFISLSLEVVRMWTSGNSRCTDIESQSSRLMKTVLSFLVSDLKDFRAAGFIVLSYVAVQMQLSAEANARILEALTAARAGSAVDRGAVYGLRLRVLVLLYQNQEGVPELPVALAESVVLPLLGASNSGGREGDIFAGVVQRFNSERFVAALMARAVSLLPAEGMSAFLARVAEAGSSASGSSAGPLDAVATPTVAKPVMRLLVARGAEAVASDPELVLPVLVSRLRELGRQHSAVLDEVISEVFESEDAKSGPRRFLGRAVKGSLRYQEVELLEQGEVTATSSLPFFLAAMHPRAPVRAVALSSLGKRLHFVLFQIPHFRIFQAINVVSAAVAKYLEDNTKFGQRITGCVIAMLSTSVLMNASVIPSQAPVYDVVLTYLIPIAIPLLLLSANLKTLLKRAGRPLAVFAMGVGGTILGGLVCVITVGRHDPDRWRIAGCFVAAYTGGTINFVSSSRVLGLEGARLAACLGVVNLVVMVYLISIFSMPKLAFPSLVFKVSKYSLGAQPSPSAEPLGDDSDAASARSTRSDAVLLADVRSPPEDDAAAGAAAAGAARRARKKKRFAPGTSTVQLLAVATSVGLCALAHLLAALLRQPELFLLFLTALVLLLATLVPYVSVLAPVAADTGLALMYVFFAVIGCSASFKAVIDGGVEILAFACVTVLFHFGTVLFAGRLLGFELGEILVGSNACIGGPASVVAMTSVVPGLQPLSVAGVVCATIGYASGTFIGVAFGHAVHAFMK